MSGDNLTRALALARRGWHVFPVAMPAKRPLVLWGSEATTDADTIAAWWTIDHPDAAVGVHCGKSGLVVGDIDEKGCGVKAHPDDCSGSGSAALKAAGIKAPKAYTYPTPSGGQHRVYAAPAGRPLTIATDHPVRHVDIRAGNGFVIFYGDPADIPGALTPAPEWALLDAKPATPERGTGAGGSADFDAYRERLIAGKPDKPVRKALKKVTPTGMAHADMLEAVTELVKLGAQGHRGVGEALDVAREVYARDWEDAARHWDNAVDGSVKRIGLPPATLPISKAERKAIAVQNRPEVIERVSREKRADRVGKRIELGAGQLTDAALAEVLAEELAGQWAHARGLGLLRYDGKVWHVLGKDDGDAALFETVRQCIRRIRADETRAAILRGDKKHEDEAKAIEGRTRIVAIARLAAGILAERTPAVDAHPDLLNVQNGVVDLRTKELLPHDPALMFTRIAGCDYDPDADRAMWGKALEALPPKVAAWVQVRMGQALTGYTPDDAVLPLFEGGGSNGKSTMLAGIKNAFGSYATTVSDRLMLANPGDHPTELTDLIGCRLAIFEELPEGRNLNVKRLKDVLGTPWLTARKMHKDNVTWKATHAIVGSTNYRLIVAETDHGTWRRLALILYPYRYRREGDGLGPITARDRTGDGRIVRHFEQTADPGVLAWLVEGAAAWYAGGMSMPRPPKKVLHDTEDWRLEADPVLSYVRDRLELDPERAIASTDLAADFNTYLEQRHARPWSESTIASRFRDHVALPGVEKRQVLYGGKLLPSRPAFTTRALPRRAMAWVGVRFQADEGRMPSEAERDAAALADLDRRVSA